MEQKVLFAEEVSNSERWICFECAVKAVNDENRGRIRACTVEPGDGNDMREFYCHECGEYLL